MKLTCLQIHPDAPEIRPAESRRSWMDRTGKFAYRCLPLSIANSFGWEILCPSDIEATWNGGDNLADLLVTKGVRGHVSSHFGYGVLTMHPGYLFRTDPGIGLWFRGPPNSPKHGIQPCEGIVETDWLPFTSTMNWQFTAPGTITWQKDEPFCHIFPVAYHSLDNIMPEIKPLEGDERQAYERWREQREIFNRRIHHADKETMKLGWQKWYTQGTTPDGKSAEEHISKLKVAAPRKA